MRYLCPGTGATHGGTAQSVLMHTSVMYRQECPNTIHSIYTRLCQFHPRQPYPPSRVSSCFVPLLSCPRPFSVCVVGVRGVSAQGTLESPIYGTCSTSSSCTDGTSSIISNGSACFNRGDGAVGTLIWLFLFGSSPELPLNAVVVTGLWGSLTGVSGLQLAANGHDSTDRSPYAA